MPTKLQFDAERWLRNNADIYTRMGSPQISQNMLLCADEIKKLRMAVDPGEQGAEHMRDEVVRLKADLAALRIASGALLSDVDKYYRCADIGESRDKLAALVGEDER